CAAAFERIGLPEGLYPLAQAALYLACADKSNSVLGFFEALRTVRESQRQDVPSHLRDAHRDGAAFGDGVGYRYPHAFAEHWVSQQYLPNALQGEVFWQPSRQGWEGQRRLMLLERRAAQLAAAAESAQEHPLLVSSGPGTPELERWLQRQLSQDGDRLHHLRERLWSGVKWQRHHRVLILGGRSLLWALDPLQAVPEGGVTILCQTSQDQSRLLAQLDLLDPMIRPELMDENCDAVNELPAQHQFEWIGGRVSSQDFAGLEMQKLWNVISQRCTDETGLRLLISYAGIGPAEALLQLLESKGNNLAERELLAPLIALEHTWLESQRLDVSLAQNLQELGWQLELEQ
ncbi:MAG: recombination protein RarA, partial [Prochlorococcaceae cyanobacterium ETNP2_MAG_10]|nr:recombination protein RarA [Prochlorococcaceae cyanobacterium ETNP2_MAG_10]